MGLAPVLFSRAAEFLNSDQIDRTRCLVADVQMPEMSGIELHRMPVPDGVQEVFVQQLGGIVRTLAALIAAEQTVYVHCNAGMNRAPTVAMLKGPSGRVAGVQIDADGRMVDVRAPVVVNADGVWSDEVRALDEGVHPASLRGELKGLGDKQETGLDVSAHSRDFFDCIKSRGRPAANSQVMRRSHIACHAAALSWMAAECTVAACKPIAE